MSDPLSREHFAEHLGDTFRLEAEGSTGSLTLLEASPLESTARKDEREPFSLVFRGAKEEVLPQRIYRLEHEALGSLDIFLVPIGPDGEGMRYEAVFN